MLIGDPLQAMRSKKKKMKNSFQLQQIQPKQGMLRPQPKHKPKLQLEKNRKLKIEKRWKQR